MDPLRDPVVVEYAGPVTVGGVGRALLHDRGGGIAAMLWEALEGAGWVGEIVSVRTTVSVRVGVAPAPVRRPRRSGRGTLPGRRRRLGERGWVDGRGVAWQQSVGPLDGRVAGPGCRLVKSQWGAEDPEAGEDLLFSAVVHAGWPAGEPDDVVDVSEVFVAVGVARRNPVWEAYASHLEAGGADGAFLPPPSSVMADRGPGVGEVAAAIDEDELVARALEVAARAGDPEPVLIQHARGTRFEITRVTGSVVFSDAPSYIVVMQGSFRARRRRPRDPSTSRQDAPEEGKFVSYPFQILVFDIETGQIIDAGTSHQHPNLASLGNVVTDREANE